MKAEATIFTNSLPEVTKTDRGLRYDFGALVLELSNAEVESLISHTLIALGPQKYQLHLKREA